MTLPRTDAEILARIHEILALDRIFASDVEVLIGSLSYAAAVQLPDETAEIVFDETAEIDPAEWDRLRVDTAEAVRSAIADHLPHAVRKANGHRGLSTMRSVVMLQAWTWLLGDDTYNAIDWSSHQRYGAPIFAAVAATVGAPWDPPPRVQRMAEGLPCVPDCLDGCRSHFWPPIFSATNPRRESND